MFVHAACTPWPLSMSCCVSYARMADHVLDESREHAWPHSPDLCSTNAQLTSLTYFLVQYNLFRLDARPTLKFGG